MKEKLIHRYHQFRSRLSLRKENLLLAISRGFGSLRAAVRCLWLVYVRKPHTPECGKTLSDFYPDHGNMPADFGFECSHPDLDLSIIIAAYNASKYIDECVGSVLSQQTGYSYEVLIVDDGSTDDTWEKLQAYSERENVRLFRQKNAGQSVARNRAISKSCGRYLMVLDSDDMLLSGAIEQLMKAATEHEADIAEGERVWFTTAIKEEMIPMNRTKFRVESNETNPDFVLTCYGYSWAKVYRRELWEHVRYPVGYIFEDIISKFILRRMANKVVFTGEAVYGYRWHNASSSHGGNPLKTLDSLWVLPKVIELCRSSGAPIDGTFYLLCMNQIGLLNRVTTKKKEKDLQLAAFAEMRKQLEYVAQYRPKHLPFWFRLLEKAILDDCFEAWGETADAIQRYRLLKKYREIN